MAKIVMKNPYVMINSVDLQDCVKSVTLTLGNEAVDTTASTSATRVYTNGLKTINVEIEFLADYAAGKVDATLNGLTTPVAVVIKPDGSSTSTSNPAYTITMLMESYDAISGSVGDAATAKATFKPNGSFSRATT